MKRTFEEIDALLREEDIEGFIEIGAPKDEYAHEAELIAKALSKLEAHELEPKKVGAVIALIWAKYFNLSEEDMQKRQGNLDVLTQKILHSQ